MKHFKDNLMELMKEKGETITSLSKATGLPASTLSEWCNGRKPMLDDGIIQLTNYLGVSIDRLVCGEEPRVNLIHEVLKSGLNHPVEIHSGIFRIRIEKL